MKHLCIICKNIDDEQQYQNNVRDNAQFNKIQKKGKKP